MKAGLAEGRDVADSALFRAIKKDEKEISKSFSIRTMSEYEGKRVASTSQRRAFSRVMAFEEQFLRMLALNATSLTSRRRDRLKETISRQI